MKKYSNKNAKIRILTLILLINFFFPLNIKNYSLAAPGDEIQLIIPEDKVYTEPDEGYYPGTYGFENDKTNSTPQEWDIQEPGGEVKVIDSIGGHNNILDLYDNVYGDNVHAKQTFIEDQSDDGAFIEFWHRTTDSMDAGTIVLYDSITEDNQIFVIGNDEGFYSNLNTSGLWEEVIPCSNNMWYHHRVVIDFTFQTFDWYIDGILEGDDIPFRQSVTQIRKLAFMTWGSNYNHHEYYDAIGYSWDPNYNFRDNLNEGLLLSFTNTTVLDWMGYSLNGQTNRTILGNTTIPVPEDGPHTIQVFGNNPFGTYIASNLCHFTVDFLGPELLLPSDTYYVEGETGNYIEWKAIDANPNGYIIRRNGSSLVAGTWSSDTFYSINIDGLAPGIYIYEFEVFDLGSHIAIDTITLIVHPKEEEPTISFGFMWIFISIISTISLCYYVKRKL